MAPSITKILVSASASLLLGACATPARVTIEALADPDAADMRRYVLVSAVKGAGPDQLEYRGFASQVVNALASKGFVHIEAGEEPDIVVALYYAAGDPQTISTTSVVPLFGQTGYSSASTTGQFMPGGRFTSTTTMTPTFGITGYAPVSSSKVMYAKYLALDAYHFPTLRDSGALREVWKASAFTMDDTPAMQSAFPVLLDAMLPVVGTSSQERDIIVQRPPPRS